MSRPVHLKDGLNYSGSGGGSNNHLTDKMVANYENSSIAIHSYDIGEQFIYTNKLYEATSAISIGDTIVTDGANANCMESDSLTEQIAKKGSADNFIGTKQQWEALTPEEQAKYKTMDFIGDNIGGGGGHTIVNSSGTELPQRSKLQFEGAIVSDDSVNDVTVVETVNPVDYEEDIYGVNLLNVKPQTVGGVTFSVDTNGYITADVSDLRGWRYTNCNTFINLKAGEYKVKAFQKTASSQWYTEFRIYKSDNTIVFQNIGWESFIANGAEFTLSEDALIGVEYKVGNGSYAFAIYKDKLDIEDYRKFNEQSIQNQLTNQTNVLGAKNLIPYPYFRPDTYTNNGITFTVNSDGSVTANGTATEAASFGCVSRNAGSIIRVKVGERYIISGCPQGGAIDKYYIVVNRTLNGSADAITRDYGDGREFTLPESDEYYGVYIIIQNNQTVTNLTFKPMLRLASDPDNTYVPYAMTNRELTDDRYYHAGDTVQLQGTAFNGFISGQAKEIVFTIPLMKDLSKVSGMTLEASGKFSVRIPSGGYLVDTESISSYNWTIRAKNHNLLSLYLKKSDNTAFKATNNSTLSINFDNGLSCKLTFS